jgi:hypothetical protein
MSVKKLFSKVALEFSLEVALGAFAKQALIVFMEKQLKP